jgi:mycofactocin precursor
VDSTTGINSDSPTNTDTAHTATGSDVADVVADEFLVEEISIDGMCGVY